MGFVSPIDVEQMESMEKALADRDDHSANCPELLRQSGEAVQFWI